MSFVLEKQRLIVDLAPAAANLYDLVRVEHDVDAVSQAHILPPADLDSISSARGG